MKENRLTVAIYFQVTECDGDRDVIAEIFQFYSFVLSSVLGVFISSD